MGTKLRSLMLRFANKAGEYLKAKIPSTKSTKICRSKSSCGAKTETNNTFLTVCRLANSPPLAGVWVNALRTSINIRVQTNSSWTCPKQRPSTAPSVTPWHPFQFWATSSSQGGSPTPSMWLVVMRPPALSKSSTRSKTSPWVRWDQLGAPLVVSCLARLSSLFLSWAPL